MKMLERMPILGMGTWELRGSMCTKAVRTALEIGYRHFDTAHRYENHEAIRKAIQGFDRKTLFLTSKFTSPQLLKETVEETCDRALKELGVEYLDLYLLHYPDREIEMSLVLQKMQKLVEKEKCKAIGVSNFTIRHLQDLLRFNLYPSVNQVEFHPYLYQKDLLDFCQKNQIQLISYRPLGKGVLVSDPIFESIGKKYGKTPAQISLRWIIEKKVPTIPKATSYAHLKENFSIFDFSLDPEEVKILDHLKVQHRFCKSEWEDFSYV